MAFIELSLFNLAVVAVVIIFSVVFMKPRPVKVAPAQANKVEGGQEIKVDLGLPEIKPSSQSRIIGLYVYPVKSLKGIPVNRVTFAKSGLKYDREWMIIDSEKHNFITVRNTPILSQIQPSFVYEEDKPAIAKLLTLHMDGKEDISVPVLLPKDLKNQPTEDVTIWGETMKAVIMGEEVNTWLSEVVGKAVKLVRMSANAPREMEQSAQVEGGNNLIAFSDRMPFTILSLASFMNLVDKCPRPKPVSNFRPNILVKMEGEEDKAHAEDMWKEIKFGKNAITFYGSLSLARCKVTGLDWNTGKEFDAEPVKTLSTYRFAEGYVFFCCGFVSKLERGVLQVNDCIEVTSHKEVPTPVVGPKP